MKKITLLLILLTQVSNANWMTSMEDAQKMALATNKFIIVDFWATWCGPCKKMELDSWHDPQVVAVLENYIQLKVDIDLYQDIARRYNISSIPNMYIMDGNGKVVHSFLGYQDAGELKKELDKFAFSTEYVSAELVNYYKAKGYNTSLRTGLKYLDYSLFVEKEAAKNIINLSNAYIDEAKNSLSKKDADYAEKKQKIELVSMFDLAYEHRYEKLSKRLSELKENDIAENNRDYYYFLKYISDKALAKADLTASDEKYKEIPGFAYYIDKANFILQKT